MKGIEKLQKHNIPLSAICVIHQGSLAFPRQLIEFFLENKFSSVGFNIEQIEGANLHSEILSREIDSNANELPAFWNSLYEHWRQHSDKLFVREFSNIEAIARCRIANPTATITPYSSQEFGSVTITRDGNIFPHSPEIASLDSAIAHDSETNFRKQSNSFNRSRTRRTDSWPPMHRFISLVR